MTAWIQTANFNANNKLRVWWQIAADASAAVDAWHVIYAKDGLKVGSTSEE
jgi:hypothetical protein